MTILRLAMKEMARLPMQDFERIRSAMAGLQLDPRPSGCSKLTGRDGWRIRVGVYRVIYDIDDVRGTVTVIHVGHRRDVYR